MRLDGDWVQCIDFRTGPTRDDYIVVHGLIYLKDEGDLALSGSLLIEHLPMPESRADIVPWRIDVGTHPVLFPSVHERLSEMFRPSIVSHISPKEVMSMLQDDTLGWHTNYVLFILTLEKRDFELADHYRQRVLPVVDATSWQRRSDEMLKEYRLPKLTQPEWARNVERRLYRYYDLAHTNFSAFVTMLDEVRTENLALLTAPKGRDRIGRLILNK
jgi:hypothetical protein